MSHLLFVTFTLCHIYSLSHLPLVTVTPCHIYPLSQLPYVTFTLCHSYPLSPYQVPRRCGSRKLPHRCPRHRRKVPHRCPRHRENVPHRCPRHRGKVPYRCLGHRQAFLHVYCNIEGLSQLLKGQTIKKLTTGVLYYKGTIK